MTYDEGTEFNSMNSDETRYSPPDTNISIGDEDIVTVANSSVAYHDKLTGGRTGLEFLEEFFDPSLPDGHDLFLFDPRALYDIGSLRHIVICAGKDNTNGETFWCLGVSQDETSDNWYTYQLGDDIDDLFVDFDTLGLDSDAIYLTANLYNGGTFQKSRIIALPKQKAYNGDSFTFYYWDDPKNPDGTSAETVQPTVDLTGASEALFLNSHSLGGSSLTLTKINNPLSGGNLTTEGVDVPTYDVPPNAKQPNTDQVLKTGDNRFTSRCYHENGSLWNAHTVFYNFNGGDGESMHAYYKIDVSSGTLSKNQAYGGPGLYNYYPAVAVTPDREMVITFNRSSNDIFPQIRAAGRNIDSSGEGLTNFTTLHESGSRYTPDNGNNANRWGDYGSIVIDPDSLSTFWVGHEIAPSGLLRDDGDWATRAIEVETS